MRSIPIVDLFAGPGGLGEGFESFCNHKDQEFKICLSIEKDPYACKTLRLRAFYRNLGPSSLSDLYEYYRRPETETFDKITKKYQHEWKAAENAARQHEMSLKNRKTTRGMISEKIKDSQKWVLVGGPPCQAYSLVGRARRTNETRRKFESDHRHTLYEEYLHILDYFQPPVFVMENVKGILSATHRGSSIFHRICEDLSKAGYELHALSGKPSRDAGGNWVSDAFVIRAEEHGVPQRRHRVFILGIRKDLMISPSPLAPDRDAKGLAEALAGIPSLRSRLSSNDSMSKWKKARHYGLEIAGGAVILQRRKAVGQNLWSQEKLAWHFLATKTLAEFQTINLGRILRGIFSVMLLLPPLRRFMGEVRKLGTFRIS